MFTDACMQLITSRSSTSNPIAQHVRRTGGSKLVSETNVGSCINR